MLDHFGNGKIGGPLARSGYLAVDLFFILSGFVMMMSYGRDFDRGGFFACFGGFIGKRLARVYPLYLLTTVVMGGCLYAGLDPLRPAFSSGVVAANIVMIQNWGIGMSLNGSAWSISTEWASYFLFPVLLPIVLRARSGIQIVTVGLCLGVLLAMTWLPPQQGRHGLLNISDGAAPWAMARCVTEFTMGMLAWRAWRSPWLDRLATGPVTTAIAVATLALWCIPNADVPTVAAFVILVPVLAFQRGIVAQWLGLRVPHVLGEWSYAIYLVHPFVGMLILPAAAYLGRHHPGHGAWSIAAVAALPVALILSGIAHHAFEKPARLWLRHALAPRSLAPVAP
jgi:peptidoglycan/LPS O-acetylase OafA/YrhL